MKVSGGRPLRGSLRPPGDETLSHTALLLAAMAEGHSLLEWLSPSLDVRSTWSCLMALGATITSTPSGEQTAVRGLGWRGLIQPEQCLKAADSGATARLLMGVIAANPIAADIIGDC
jgi:3-phosphoshikimate 1-carboxyvinyltransferase